MDPEYQFFSGCFLSEPLMVGSLFCDLSEECQSSLSAITRPATFEESTIVASKNHHPDIYVLRKGYAEIIAFNNIDKQLAIQFVEQDEMIGVNEILANLPFRSTLKTITSCDFDLIDARDFLGFLKEQNEICLRLVKQLGADICKSSNDFSLTYF